MQFSPQLFRVSFVEFGVAAACEETGLSIEQNGLLCAKSVASLFRSATDRSHYHLSRRRRCVSLVSRREHKPNRAEVAVASRELQRATTDPSRRIYRVR
jgi:hypothetical protein